MGNSCNISYPLGNSSLKQSPYPSLTFPPTPEFLDNVQSQYKGDFPSQINYHSLPTSTASLPTLNALKQNKKIVFCLNRRNLKEAIQQQQQMSPTLSPLKRESMRFFRNQVGGSVLPREKGNKDSSFFKYGPSSFQTSVSEILDDGCMEYSRDSETLKVEDLWQDVSKTASNDLQKAVDSKVDVNFEDRKRSDSYPLLQSKYNPRTSCTEDKRGSMEPTPDSNSPKQNNLKKAEVRTFQARVEREGDMNKMSLFSDKKEGVPVPESQQDKAKIFSPQIIQDIEISDQDSIQDSKETRMIQGLTTVAQSFSPIKKSSNASPEEKKPSLNGFEDNPFREDKSLYNESVSAFETSPMKTPNDSPQQIIKDKNYYSATKDMYSGSKSLIKYCSVGALEPTAVTGLYEGVQSSEANNQIYSSVDFKQNNLHHQRNGSIHDISHRSYTNENLVGGKNQRIRDMGTRKSSIMERLMESLLEENAKTTENSYIMDTSEKQVSPFETVRDSPEKDKRVLRSISTGARRKSQFAVDQTDNVSRKVETESREKEGDLMGLQEKARRIETEDIRYCLPKKEAKTGGNILTVNNKASSVHGSRAVSPLLKPEVPEPSPEQTLNLKEEYSKIAIQNDRGEIITDHKAIMKEIKTLQSEVFERMSAVTTNIKGTMLTPKKMLDLKDIQDKIQILTQLSSMIEAKDVVPENAKQSTVANGSDKKPSLSHNKKLLKKVIGAGVTEKSNNNKHKGKEEGRYSSYSKGYHQAIKRNSSLSDINATKKNIQINKSISIQPGEPEFSVLKSTKNPSETTSTQEFLHTENECSSNPKVVKLHPTRKALNRKATQNLSWAGEFKLPPRSLEFNIDREVSCYYQTEEAKLGREAEVFAKSYLTNDITPEKHSMISVEALLAEKEICNQSQPEVENNQNNGIYDVITKLSQPKNLSTYQSQSKEGTKQTSIEHSKNTVNTRSGKQINTVSRRQSVIEDKAENKKVNMTCDVPNPKSRVNSIEILKVPTYDRKVSVNKNEKASHAKQQINNKKVSIGSSNTTKDYVKSILESRKKSVSPIKYVDNEKKRRLSQVTQTQETVEKPPETEIGIETLLNECTLENNQTELLYEEISQLNHKLAVAKCSSKTDMLEKPVQKSPILKAHTIDQNRKKNLERSYSKQATRKSERHITPLAPRVVRQNSNPANDLQDRKATMDVPELSVQQEQQDTYATTEASCADMKKLKYNYNQAVQLRLKYVEEAARRQSIAESTEWILKLPLPTGVYQEKGKKI